MKVTKKDMIADYPKLREERDLLQYYFWDNRAGVKPYVQVKEQTNYSDTRNDTCTFSLYRIDRAHGGYIVIEWNPGTPCVLWWEQWAEYVRRAPFGGIGEVESAYKRAVERLTNQVADLQPKVGA